MHNETGQELLENYTNDFFEKLSTPNRPENDVTSFKP